MTKPQPVLYLDSARGIYIPRDFAQSFASTKYVSGVSNTDLEILEEGPNGALYWDVWTDVLNNAIITGDDGIPYFLSQDNDLWLIPAGMEWSDETDFFVWPQS
jgi:hypothetical protein